MYTPLLLPLLAKLAATVSAQGASLSVDATQRFQTVDGFGFSEAFQRANQIIDLPEASRKRTLDLLFSDTEGAGFTILRNGIGSSPNSNNDWMNSIEPVNPGSPSAPPKYHWDGKDSGQVWMSKQAKKYGVKTFYADAWSAPGYMKTNNDDSNGGYLCGIRRTHCSSGDWKQAFANYLVKYLHLYEQSGIPITHVGFLNEPDLNITYASMQSDGAQAADFLKVLVPTLRKAGLGTNVVCCDATGWLQQGDILYELQEAGGEDLVNVVSSHGYQSQPSLPFNTDRPVWQTEWANLDDPWTAAWDHLGKTGEGIVWANYVQQTFVQSNVSAFIYWIGAENSTDNSMLIRLNGDSVEPSGRLWAMAQFSRFVKPGAVRIAASSTKEVLHMSAFENTDGTIAIQVINNGHVGTEASVSIKGASGSAKHVQPYLTNSDHDLTVLKKVSVENGNFVSHIPARSMISFVLKK
ncbi:O-Glycosyl hydrolase family 30 [Aspergillus sclerotialis]|uniref:O-Glycosyl hydrolase family 30 n=1 Tax=Aspergillus sclerotialis TaxID=2070753 RepID=A0A3A2ZKL8_9EURO|nr:O-Glycosyl hydrolase family 30 [Aspergillus sclerotialis]